MRATGFGSGPRGCAGQWLARSILRPTLKFIATDFAMPEADHAEESRYRWAQFDPREGHRFSGRTNDDQDDSNAGFMASKIAGFFGTSFVIGFKRRVGMKIH